MKEKTRSAEGWSRRMALQPLDHFGILLEFHNSSLFVSAEYAALMSADSVCSGLSLHSAKKKSFKDSPMYSPIDT